jgi:Uma2 family endonuclease
MTPATPTTPPPAAKPRRRKPGQAVVIRNVDWKQYLQMLKALGEHPRVRLTYDRGSLEIMSPSLKHDGDGDILGDFVKALAREFRLPIHRGGSVTLKRRRMKKGLEPDRCLWLRNAPRIAGVRDLDLRIHPPPDLAIEVDVTNSSLDRMGIYAAIKVPEVWRLDGDVLTFHALGADGNYAGTSSSLSFPGVTPADLFPFLQRARVEGDQTQVFEDFLAWARKRAAARSAPPPTP